MRKIKDLTGQKFFRLLVIKKSERKGNFPGQIYWDCVCDCGNYVTVMGQNLKRGHTKSCGCWHKEQPKGYLIDLKGKIFGRLTVLELDHVDPKMGAFWLCLCECGKKIVARASGLKNGHAKSCGCLQKEIVKNMRMLEEGEASLNALYGGYRNKAIERNYEFNLTKDEFTNLTKQNCYYCGREPSQVKVNVHNNGDYIYNGIDRIDNSIGYIVDNCVPCCGLCNWLKRDLSIDAFRQTIKSIYNYWIKENNGCEAN